MYEDLEGDVFLSSSWLYHEGAIDPDYDYSFDPGLKIVDLPLEVGNTWVTFSGGSPACLAYFEFQVILESEIVVPAGTFFLL